MNVPSNPLAMQVQIRDQDHFEAVNDFICFQRHQVKDFTWDHDIDGGSKVDVEFHYANDALVFKLTYG